jgi:serine/threonine protein kinase
LSISSSPSIPSELRANGEGLAASPAPGRVIGDRYRLVRRVGAGGMATVYEAIDERTERIRAVKVLQASLVSSEAHRRRFTREATVTARFASDHVVDVLDAGIDAASGSPFLVMPLLPGRDLAAEIEAVGAIDPVTVVSYLTQTARALDRAHEARIVHRDLKPANVFLVDRDDGSRQVLVLDFGIAKLIDRVSTRATESILGSPLYLAPEQVRYKKERVTERADIYALGQLAYTALVGEAYYSPEDEASDGVMGLLMEMAVGETQPASERARARRSVELPHTFDAWFSRATARDPAARFESASQAVVALARVFDLPAPELRAGAPARVSSRDELDDSAIPEDELEPRPIPMRNRRNAAIGLAVLALMVAAAVWAIRAARPELPAAPAGPAAQAMAAEPVAAVPADPTSSAIPPVVEPTTAPPALPVSPAPSVSAATAAVASSKATTRIARPTSAPIPTATAAPLGAGGYVPPVTER